MFWWSFPPWDDDGIGHESRIRRTPVKVHARRLAFAWVFHSFSNGVSLTCSGQRRASSKCSRRGRSVEQEATQRCATNHDIVGGHTMQIGHDAVVPGARRNPQRVVMLGSCVLSLGFGGLAIYWSTLKIPGFPVRSSSTPRPWPRPCAQLNHQDLVLHHQTSWKFCCQLHVGEGTVSNIFHGQTLTNTMQATLAKPRVEVPKEKTKPAGSGRATLILWFSIEICTCLIFTFLLINNFVFSSHSSWLFYFPLTRL